MQKKCRRCNNNFTSKANRPEIDFEIRNYIKENYDDCLCSDCIRDTSLNFYALDINPKFLAKMK